MVDRVRNTRVEARGQRGRIMVAGVVTAVLGLLVIAVAAIEFYVFADVLAPKAADDRFVLFGMTVGTGAYVLGYAGAGAILLVIGAWKIYRARRGD